MTVSILARQRTRLERLRPFLVPGATFVILVGLAAWITASRWRAIAAVEEAGGALHFVRPHWVRVIEGYLPRSMWDTFSIPEEATLIGPDIRVDALDRVARLGPLSGLILRGTKLGDAGMEKLAGMPATRFLWIEADDITTAGLAHLTHRKGLRQLRLSKMRLNSADLALIGQIPELEEFGLDRCILTDDALNDLRGFERLRSLRLAQMPIGDADLRSIHSLKNLEDLFLDGTNLTNEGLSTVGRLPGLKRLGVMETSVDDNGLDALSSCTRLERLFHKQTGVTETGLGKLKQCAPGLLVGTY